MKKYILIMVTFLALVSCEKYLDKSPDLGFTEEIVFNDFYSVRGYFDKVYDLLDDYNEWGAQGAVNPEQVGRHAITAEMSDEAANVFKDRSEMGTIINMGLWLGNNAVGEIGWNDGSETTTTGDDITTRHRGKVIPKSFYGIRICNRILETVPELTHLTRDEKDQLLGQAYFLRGWFYFEVIRRIGGFPVLDRQYNSDDDGNMERLTYAESSDWIIENMDQAISLLPNKWDDTQTGRPTKSSAYALKSMAQLYSASPLMTNGIDRTDPKTEYDQERVILAARYASECLDYLETNKDVYDQTLMPGTGPGRGTQEGLTEYANIIYHPPSEGFMSREALWYVNQCGINMFNGGTVGSRYYDIIIIWLTYTMTSRPGNYGTPVATPTQNLINKFETIGGYRCELGETGFENCADPGFDINEPYRNRDPRLYHYIMLPGERFGSLGSGVFESTAYPNPNPDADRLGHYLTTFVEGRDNVIQGNAEGGRGDALTKYLCKKYVWPSAVRGTNSTGNTGDNTYSTMLIRTTQIWLDYAEAMNEAYGPNGNPEGYRWGSAVDAVNVVRKRAGHVEVLPVHTGSQVAFRDKIRDERAIELCFENHRWFDIRRWMIAEALFSGANPIKGAQIDMKPEYVSQTLAKSGTPYSHHFPPGLTQAEREDAKYGKCFIYKLNPIPEEVRVFERKHYWYPIRRDEINRFPALKQNPGW